MRNTLLIIAFLFLVCSFLGCQSENRATDAPNDINSVSMTDSLDLIKSISFDNEKIFALDKQQSGFTDFVQIFNDRLMGEQLIMFDDKQLRLHKYNFETGERIKHNDFEVEGPNGVGKIIDGFHYLNSDSVFIASRYVISLVNESGKVLRRYDISRLGVTGIPRINAKNPLNLSRDRKSIYISIVPDVDANEKYSDEVFSILKIDLRTGDTKYIAPYPTEYEEKVFGANYLYSFTCETEEPGRILLGFSGSSNIVNLDFEQNKSFKIFAPSRKFNEVSNSLGANADFNQYTKFYVTNPSFENCIRDRKHQLYYRVVCLPRSEDEFREGKQWKRKNVIVLNSRFKKVGDVDVLNENLNFSQILSSASGTYVADFMDENHFKIARINPIRQ